MRAFLLATVVLTGCAGAPVRVIGERRASDPTWARAGGSRVRFVGTLSTPEHLGIERSWWTRVLEFFAGEVEPTALARPVAVAFSDDGRLAVADAGLRGVRVYEPKRQQHVLVKERLRAPAGVTFAGELLLVADGELRRVFAFDRGGHEVSPPWAWPTFGRPAGLAWDAARARLFVADPAAHCVHVISARGNTTLGHRGDEDGAFNFPTHVAWAAEQLFVTDALNARVQTFDAQLGFVRAFGGRGDTPGDTPRPKGLAIDRRGTVWVVEGAFDAVQAFDAQGQLVALFGGAGTDEGRFWLPSGAAIDERGLLYVADTWNARVQVFALEEVGP
ncbi:MAG: hypothetical protein ACOZQL_36190 [Myxococcota bacterium]